MNLQNKYELKGSIQQWVDSFMIQYQISASDMVDGINSVLLNLKDRAVQEMFEELYRFQANVKEGELDAKEEEPHGESDLQD